MQVPPRYCPSKGPVGFTLIELLVVITIVAILAALVLPVFSKVQDRARTVQAVNDMRNIKVSIISYYTDYQKYPVTDGQVYYAENDPYSDTDFGDPGGYYWSADLFDILRAQANTRYNVNNELNPNQVVYWPGTFAKSAVAPKSGITTQDVKDGADVIHKGDLVDPWGNPYVVWVDVHPDGDLTKAISWYYYDYSLETDVNAVKPGLPPLGVECASYGPDGEWGTKDNNILKGSDDIVTWPH